MSEVLVRYVAEVVGPDGRRFVPQACGAVAEDGLWEGWIEFVGQGEAVRTGRETEQPSRDMLMYWAQGLTATYLDGALVRATRARTEVPREPKQHARFDRPAPPPRRAFRPSRAILDPFATFAQGEHLLRGQLNALSHDNLVTIVADYRLEVRGADDMPARRLIDAIVDAVKFASTERRLDRPARDSSETAANPPIRQPDDLNY